MEHAQETAANCRDTIAWVLMRNAVARYARGGSRLS